MWKLFGQPYPIEEPIRRRWTKSFWIGVFVGLFLFVFQPFGLSDWHTPNKPLIIAGFGVITFLVTALNYVLVPALFPKHFRDEHWTVGREIVHVMLNILLIGLTNRLYLYLLVGGHSGNGPDLLNAVLVTFLVGLFPVTATVMITYIVQLKKYANAAAELPVHAPLPAPAVTPEPTAPAPAQLTLVAENDKDSLTLAPADLLFIESSDNYSTIVYLKNGQPTRQLLRSSLSRLEGQLPAETTVPDTAESNSVINNSIVRCHRSFIVNLGQVEKVTGNAQGYKLHLCQGKFQIPVARKYNDSLIVHLKALA